MRQPKINAPHLNPKGLIETNQNIPHLQGGGGGFSMGKFLSGKIECGKTSATIVKSDGKNCATLFHGEGQGLRSALLTEGDTT